MRAILIFGIHMRSPSFWIVIPTEAEKSLYPVEAEKKGLRSCPKAKLKEVVILSGEPMNFLGTQRRIMRRQTKHRQWQSFVVGLYGSFVAQAAPQDDNVLRPGVRIATRCIADSGRRPRAPHHLYEEIPFVIHAAAFDCFAQQ